jgi:hypothetical protein
VAPLRRSACGTLSADELLVDEYLLDEWRGQVYCPINILEHRERAGGDRKVGLSHYQRFAELMAIGVEI